MFDLDGAYEHSNTIRISNTDAPEASVFPNPFDDKLTLQLKTQQTSNATIEISDVSGKIIYQNIFKTEKGLNSLEIFSSLNTGMYFLKFKNNSTELFYKILKN